MKCAHVDCDEEATVTVGLASAPSCWKHATPVRK